MMLTIRPEFTNDLHGNTAPSLLTNPADTVADSSQIESRDHARLLNTVLVLFILAVVAYIFFVPLFG